MSDQTRENQSTKRKLENTAIGSWAGYIYQGLCGIYHALTLIIDDREGYTGFFLSLDSYEDFSVLNESQKIVSLHQCKDVKDHNLYEDEQEKMKCKQEYLKNKGLLADSCKLYFHNAHNIPVQEGIILYQYHNGHRYCKPDGILTLIREKVAGSGQDRQSELCIVAQLAQLVNAKVLEVQAEFFRSRQALKEIAPEKARIPFAEILNILDGTNTLSLERDQQFSYLRNSLFLSIHQYLIDLESEGEQIDDKKVNSLVFSLLKMNDQQAMDFFRRICPDQDLDFSWSALSNWAPDHKANMLVNLLQDIKHPLNEPELNWNRCNSKQTPTVLQCAKRNVSVICRNIIKNAPNLDCLREYDWLVGDVPERIPSIIASTNVITLFNGEDLEKHNRSIFAMKNVGILSINDFNDENFA